VWWCGRWDGRELIRIQQRCKNSGLSIHTRCGFEDITIASCLPRIQLL
jgi:hypothetical protein